MAMTPHTEASTLSEWLGYIEEIHVSSMDLTLDRVKLVFERLLPEGVPFRVVTVAGTNGKGSCCAYLESILLAAGYSVGKYTSPHITRFNERICLNGSMVDDELVCAAFSRIEAARADVSLTYFEYTTLAALLVFAEQAVEVVVCEVGLGGRMDAVNILDPEVTIVTSIGLDHTQWLGDTREAIAMEKVAVARPHSTCVIGELDIPQVMLDYLVDNNSKACCLNQHFSVDLADDDCWNIKRLISNTPSEASTGVDSSGDYDYWVEGLPKPIIAARHQYQNAACATMALLQTDLKVSAAHIHQGIENASIAGRCQILMAEPLVIVDVAHNKDSVEALYQFVVDQKVKGDCYAVFSMLNDKDIEACVACMAPLISEWHIAPLNVPRASLVEDLREVIHLNDPAIGISEHSSVGQAYQILKKQVKSTDCLIVFGSFHVVGDII